MLSHIGKDKAHPGLGGGLGPGLPQSGPEDLWPYPGGKGWGPAGRVWQKSRGVQDPASCPGGHVRGKEAMCGPVPTLAYSFLQSPILDCLTSNIYMTVESMLTFSSCYNWFQEEELLFNPVLGDYTSLAILIG